MNDGVPWLNQCNFENVMAKSIIYVWSQVSRAVSCLIIRWMTGGTNWEKLVPRQWNQTTCPRWQTHVPQRRVILQALPPCCVTANGRSDFITCGTTWRMHDSSKWWPSITTKRWISYCTSNEIYGHLRRRHTFIECKSLFTVSLKCPSARDFHFNLYSHLSLQDPIVVWHGLASLRRRTLLPFKSLYTPTMHFGGYEN